MPEFRAISHQLGLSVDWDAIKDSPLESAASALKSILGHLEGAEERIFAVRGRALVLVQERETWKLDNDPEVDRPFTSMDRWLKVTFPKSWRYCYDALWTAEELKELPFSEVSTIRRCNLKQLERISSGVRALPEVRQAAQTKTKSEFVAFVNEKFPEQHLEPDQPVIMPKGDADEFEAAIEMAMVCEECRTRAEAIKAIAVNYIQEHAAVYEHRKGVA